MRNERKLTARLTVLCLLPCFAACSSDGGESSVPASQEPVPQVGGPVTTGAHGGLPFNCMPEGLAEQFDYVEEEYLVKGMARSMVAEDDEAWLPDGKWTAKFGGDTARYETRILVRAPRNARDFNGTVFVEWFNVSSGMDADPDFGLAHEELLREGTAYVGVSAQRAGIVSGGGLIPIDGIDIRALKDWDGERYGTLEHPGDDYSYDIFTQVAHAIRRGGLIPALRDLGVRHVVAAGESQSAGRMTTYVNAVQPVTQAFDGFLVHSRAAGGAPLSASVTGQPRTALLRTDGGVPVMQFVTETDLFVLGFLGSRQEDDEFLRTWEVAGTSHADRKVMDYGIASGLRADPDANVDFARTCGAVNDGPQSDVLKSAVASLLRWVERGEAPAAGQPFEVADGALVRDELGNVVGGVRSPAVDAPVARLSGTDNAAAGIFCQIFGSTSPFDAETLRRLYPTHEDYVERVQRAAREAVERGHLLQLDADGLIDAARAARVPE